MEVKIPEFADLGESYISGNFIVLKLDAGDDGDIVRAFPFNVSGSWPNSTGIKSMEIEMSSGNVTIEASG